MRRKPCGEPAAGECLHHRQRCSLALEFGRIRTAQRKLGLELRKMALETKLDAAVRCKTLNPFQQRIGMRFAETERMEPLHSRNCGRAAARKQSRDDFCIKHQVQLLRHSRREIEARPADSQLKTARRPDWIVDYFRCRGQ